MHDGTAQAALVTLFTSVVTILSASTLAEVEVTSIAVPRRLFSLLACIVVARLRAPIHIIAFKQLVT
ncbi:unnamed protein product [Brugia timori]|uniref:Uncharacterized protein n=1 Tax=Brugia timori TaxID=42155 RepID=A0A3P7ZZU1_9BILA|nr:unnamed protein product [Brugia timori]